MEHKIKVVIADDHTIFRDGLRRLLEMEPELQVAGEAANGEEAVSLVNQLRPEILLLDLAMPKLPGLEALRELEQLHASTKTIVLTASIERRQIVEALQCGARGIVTKDCATGSLLKAIAAVMQGLYWVGEQAVANPYAYLEQPSAAKPRSRSDFGLTRRESEILVAIVAGLNNRDIAARFSLSEDTVKHHLTSIFDKVGVSNRLELALFAINHHLTDS
jgi:DNA-binding NarL/FixJ family response regulator